MSNIQILDCTLRDGGYINNWNFGFKNIKTIREQLEKSKVEFVELGYLTEKKQYDNNYTCFNNISEINELIPDNAQSKYLCMINFGEYDINHIPEASSNNLFGIRVAFHKRNMVEALEYCKQLKEKGYNVFVQPMLTMTYSKEELSYFLDEVNKLQPYAVYIVDSFGYMNGQDVLDKTENFLDKIDDNITIGFHSHNNLQLAFSNSQTFVALGKNRKLILDSSIYGMGRGAGNLNTELIMQHLNQNYGKKYEVFPLLYVVDNILEIIKSKKYWGYSLIYYLSAIYKCHPNYSMYFGNISTLSTSDMNEILGLITDDKKISFDEAYAEELYETHFSKAIDQTDAYNSLLSMIGDKDILLLGSGSSVSTLTNEIIKKINDGNIFTISVNNYNENIDTDAVFISNRKRYSLIKQQIEDKKIISTSNVHIDGDSVCIFDYSSNLARELKTSDNALLLLINILCKLNKRIYLGGFDGFTLNPDNNYYSSDLAYVMNKNKIEDLNQTMKDYIELYSEKADIKFITPSLYIDNHYENNASNCKGK